MKETKFRCFSHDMSQFFLRIKNRFTDYWLLFFYFKKRHQIVSSNIVILETTGKKNSILINYNERGEGSAWASHDNYCSNFFWKSSKTLG